MRFKFNFVPLQRGSGGAAGATRSFGSGAGDEGVGAGDVGDEASPSPVQPSKKRGRPKKDPALVAAAAEAKVGRCTLTPPDP